MVGPRPLRREKDLASSILEGGYVLALSGGDMNCMMSRSQLNRERIALSGREYSHELYDE